MILDLNDLAVESFPTADGDPSQWLMRAPAPTWDPRDSLCRPQDEPELYATTVERICTTTL